MISLHVMTRYFIFIFECKAKSDSVLIGVYTFPDIAVSRLDGNPNLVYVLL